MTCPWAKIPAPEPVNLQEIMSEEVARELQAKEDKRAAISPTKPPKELWEAPPELPAEVLEAIAKESPCESDAVIARMLQMQFDKEYDENLKRSEEKFNGASKVSISFENYRRAPQNFDFESDSEEEEVEDVRDKKNWDRFDAMKKQFDSMPPRGYKMENGSMVTKHDGTMSGRKNACKMLSFPPDFQTGDGENFDMKLSNNVFNHLKRHSLQEEAKRHRLKDKKEDRATAEFGLDRPTKLLLYKMLQKGLLEDVNGVISIGKEAVVLDASGNPGYSEEYAVPEECVIKVFKTTLSEFKQRDKYIKDDHRFKDRIGKQSARKTVHLWAEKEKHNLNRLKNAGIPCPEVVELKEHVLVMSLIGKGHRPARKLKDAAMDSADYIVAYQQVVDGMKTMFRKADLIHADLSEYNILWHDGRCHFIDVSQSVLLVHENSFFFLMRDCYNVTKFFSRKKVPKVQSHEELFKSITGYYYDEKDALLKLQQSIKMKPHLADRPDVESEYNFNEAWAKTRQGVVGGPNLVEPPLA